MNALMMPATCRSTRLSGRTQRCIPRLLVSWDQAQITPPPPVPENPLPSPPEMPDPHGPVGVPPPMENPIPVREPPTTLPPQS